jgi:hypothetical protein
MSTLRTAACAGAAVLSAGLALASPAVAAPPLECNGSAALCDRPFDQVVLAGSHNSMSSAADGFTTPNQQVGIAAQLKDGIRAFLVDSYAARRNKAGKLVALKTTPRKTDRLYLCHTACENGAVALSKTLGDMATFLRRNPGAVLLVVNQDEVAPSAFIREVKKSAIAKYLYRGSTSGPWPTLGAMVKSDQRIVMLAENKAAGAPWYHRAYAGTMQETPYSWPDETVLTDPARGAESCIPNRGGTTGPLFLMNHWSPPFGANPAAGARVNAHATIVARARACQQVRGKLPTVIAVDMSRSGDVVGAVRELNGV